MLSATPQRCSRRQRTSVSEATRAALHAHNLAVRCPRRWGPSPQGSLSLPVKTETVSSLGSRGDYLVKMDFFFFFFFETVKIAERHSPCRFTRPLHSLQFEAWKEWHFQALVIWERMPLEASLGRQVGHSFPGGSSAHRPNPAVDAWASTVPAERRLLRG